MWSYCTLCVADDGCMKSIHVMFGTNQSSVNTHDFPWGGGQCVSELSMICDLLSDTDWWLRGPQLTSKSLAPFWSCPSERQPEGQGEEENASVSSWRSYGVCAYLLTVLIAITVTYPRIRTKYYIIIKFNDTQVNTKAEISYYSCLV